LIVHKFTAVSILAAGFLVVAAAQITKTAPATYVLRAKYQKGQVIKFMTVSGIDSKSNALAGTTLKIPITLRVLDVKKGVATVRLTMSAVVLDGQVVQPEQSATFPLDNRNRGESGSQSIGAHLPIKPIKVGGTWKSVMPVNIGGTTAALEGVYRFAGVQTVNGHLVGVITYSLSGPATGTGTLMMLASDGTMYSNETRLAVTGGGGNRALTRIHSTMTRN